MYALQVYKGYMEVYTKPKGTVAMSTANFLWPNVCSQPLQETRKIGGDINLAMMSTKVLCAVMQSFPSLREIQPKNQTVSMDECHLSSAPMPELQ